MRTPVIKVNAKKETVRFNIYFSFRELYNNNKTKSGNNMISHMRYIAHRNLLACVHARVRAITLVSANSVIIYSNTIGQ